MNDQNNAPQDDELEGFDSFEDDIAIDEPVEPIDDADFQDISDDVDADVFGEGEPAPKPTKKTSWFNIGIAVVAVVVAGGLIFMKLGPQLMGGSDNVPMSAPVADNGNASQGSASGAQSDNAQSAAQAALAPDGKSQAAASKAPGLLDSPDQLSNLSTATAPPPVKPAPSTIADPFAGLPNTPNATAPVAASPDAAVTVPAPGPVAAAKITPTTTSVPMPAPITAAPITTDSGALTPTLAAGNDKAATTAMPSGNAAPSSVLESKVSSLEERMNDMDSKLTAIASAPAASDTRLNTIQTTLERLETRLDDIASRKSSTPRAVSAPAVITGDDNNASSGPAPVKRAIRKAVPVKAKKTQPTQWDKAYSPARATPVSATASAGGSSGWELRGATPGRATVARGSDIREIGVGEAVPGLGEITGVAQVNGQWVVQGTQGRLAQ